MTTVRPIGVEETNELPADKRRARADEEFSLLVYRQNRFVFRVAYALLRNVQDAEDVVQEAFLKLYRKGGWHELRDERSFLARMAWRLALDHLRASPVRSAASMDADETPSPGASPEAQAVSADSTAAIHRLIDTLPEEFRQPLVLSGIDGMTSREIGTILGLPEGTVRTRLLRARQLLKEKLNRAGGEHDAG